MATIVMITGANSGMGLATATLLANQGYRVYAGYRQQQKSAQLLNQDQTLSNLIPIYLDVMETHSITQAVEYIIEQEGRLDVLINNAGYGYISTIEHCDANELYRQFDVNVFGVVRCMQAVIPQMMAQGIGHIINISSFLGKMGLPYLSLYNASKYAVEGISDSARYELAPFNIKVSTIAPGLFQTGFANSGAHIEPATIDPNSTAGQTASHFINNLANKINHGSDPALIAQSVLTLLQTPTNIWRTAIGADAQVLDDQQHTLSHRAFETAVASRFGITDPNTLIFSLDNQ